MFDKIFNRKKFLGFLTLSLILISFESNVYAENSVKLTGSFNFISAIRDQTRIDDTTGVKSNKKRYIFDSCSRVSLDSKTTTDNDIEYGLKLVLGLTSLHDGSYSINGSHIFISKDDIGKLELGSPYPASVKMGVTADAISAETFLWDNYALLNSSQNKGVEYKFYSSYLGSYRTEVKNRYAEPSRCVSYYTPVLNGFQGGISYIPDSLNTGGQKFNQEFIYHEQRFILKDGTTYKTIAAPKNIISLGITYDKEILENANLKLGGTLELGKAIQKNTDNLALDESNKINDLKAYNLGLILSYDNVSLGASYYDLGKSFVSKSKNLYDKSRSETKYYSIATSYNQGPFDVSVIYYNTNHRKNILHSYTAAVSYKFMPGLNSTIELTKFNGSGYSNKSIDIVDKKQKTEGLIVILSLKLQF